ncbi:MAG: hypothetical protein N2595_07825 [bacterium]|nr:hypothetical protein [bacterium]
MRTEGFSLGTVTQFTAFLEQEQQLQRFLKKREEIYLRPGTRLFPEEVALLTAACYWCEMRVAPEIVQSLIASGNHTAAYEAIEVLITRVGPRQQSYRDSFALDKAYILRRWGRHEDAAALLEQIVERNAHKTNRGCAHFVMAHAMLAEIRASQGRMAEAQYSFDELLRCPLDEETRASFEEQRKILLEPGYVPQEAISEGTVNQEEQR